MISNRSFRVFDFVFSTDPLPFLDRLYSLRNKTHILDDICRLIYGSDMVDEMKKPSKFYWVWKNNPKSVTEEKIRKALSAIMQLY